MKKITEDIFCDCGEYRSVKCLQTNEIEVDNEVEHHSIDNQKVVAMPLCMMA